MVFGALPQELLCDCTKESAFACNLQDYSIAMDDESDLCAFEQNIDALADAFLDLWQDNIRLWSMERDLFTLESLIEAVNNSTQAGSVGDDP